MASYRYQRGDQPLEGYTIEHAVGRGGFGEVYYAVSDSGKQVALKAVQNYEDIELRGSTHCMNLKSPHLVTIFDVRHSERGDPFVIMEYVSGPSLRELLDDAPEGLGPEKSAWFIREIAKAVSMLHGNGIVHRDLKPHNVFFEDGYVKVGDYSLSKVITTSHRSGHTLTVGTVHYMAPEISLGRYDCTVDIYAMGVLLYEMLTGKPPFLGESMGEVLMKHMSQDVDVSSLPQTFAAVVQKAMARDPEERYQSPDELVEALFGTDAVRDGASGFDPGSLTMIARRAVEKSRPMPATVARNSNAPKVHPQQNALHQGDRYRTASRPKSSPLSDRSKNRNNPNTIPFLLGQLVSRLGARFAMRPYPAKAFLWNADDDVPSVSRLLLGVAVALAGAMATTFLIYAMHPSGTLIVNYAISPDGLLVETSSIAALVTAIIGSIAFGVLKAGRLFAPGMTQLPWFVVRIVYFVSAAVPGILVSWIAWSIGHPLQNWNELFLALLVPLAVQDWRWLTSSRRCSRLSLAASLTAAIIGAVAVSAAVGDDFAVVLGAGAIATAAAVVQIVAPFSERRSRRIAESTNWLESVEGLGEALARVGTESGDSVMKSSAAASGTRTFSPMVHEDQRSAEQVTSDITQENINGDDFWWETEEESSRGESENTLAGVNTQGKAATDETPRARMPALVLSLVPFVMMPFFGLHRFYAGKNFSGVVYLLTLGLFGVGQLVDVILIALGEFRDAEGRLLTTWRSSPNELSTVGEKVNSLSVIPSPRSLFSDGLAVVGGLFLALDIALGFLLAINGPKLIAAGAFSPIGLSPEFMANVLGMADWQDLVFQFWAIVCGVLSAATVGLLMTSRLRYGIPHVIRVLPAGFALGMVFAMLMEGTRRIQWEQVVESLNRKQVGPALQAILSGDMIACSIGSAVAFSAALFILAWPPRQKAIPIVEQVRTPVAQGR